MSDEERSKNENSETPTEENAKPADENAKPADENAKPADENAKPADENAKNAKPADAASDADTSEVKAEPKVEAKAEESVKPEAKAASKEKVADKLAAEGEPKPDAPAKAAPAADKPAAEGEPGPEAPAKAAPAADKPAAEGEPKPDAPAKAAPAADKPAADKPAASADAKPTVKPAPAKPTAAAAGDAPAKKAPPKKEAPPPDPRAIAAKELAEQIKATIAASLGEDVVEEASAAQYKPMLRIRNDRWAQTVDLLKKHEAWQLNYIEMMAGTDYPDYLEVVVYIQSTELGHSVLLKTRTDREKAEVPSLVSIHPGVNWEEREIYDLLGVTFTNHPDLRRIMMWEGFKGHPLRKDYTPWEGEEDPDVAE